MPAINNAKACARGISVGSRRVTYECIELSPAYHFLPTMPPFARLRCPTRKITAEMQVSPIAL